MYNVVKKNIAYGLSKNLVSAIITQSKKLDIGLPCILDLDTLIESNGSSIFSGKIVPTNLKDIIKEAIENEADRAKILNEKLFCSDHLLQMRAKSAFSIDSKIPPGHLYSVNNNQIYCTKITPIIQDKFKSISVEKFSDIVTSNAMPELPDKITEALKKYRYLNYELKEVTISKINKILDGLTNMAKSLIGKYQYSMCVYFYGNARETLVDLISISFHRISDVMPIFDYRKTSGIAVEIVLTNSMYDINHFGYTGHNMNHYIDIRFVFSRHRDNLFTIDGEHIMRTFQCGVFDAIRDKIQHVLNNYTPDDQALSKLQQKENIYVRNSRRLSVWKDK